MRVEEALLTVLAADAPAVALLGNRVYPDVLPPNPKYPCAVYERVSGSPFSGICQDSTWSNVQLQVTVYDRHKAGVRAASTALSMAWKRYRGTVANVQIDDVLLTLEADGYSLDLVEGLRSVILDFNIYFSES